MNDAVGYAALSLLSLECAEPKLFLRFFIRSITEAIRAAAREIWLIFKTALEPDIILQLDALIGVFTAGAGLFLLAPWVSFPGSLLPILGAEEIPFAEQAAGFLLLIVGVWTITANRRKDLPGRQAGAAGLTGAWFAIAFSYYRSAPWAFGTYTYTWAWMMSFYAFWLLTCRKTPNSSSSS